MIIFVKIYCYWTRTVKVIAKGNKGPVFFETQFWVDSSMSGVSVIFLFDYVHMCQWNSL